MAQCRLQNDFLQVCQIWFFSNLVAEEGSLLVYKDPNSVCTTFAKLSDLCNSEAFHSNPWTLDPLNPFNIINSFGDDP